MKIFDIFSRHQCCWPMFSVSSFRCAGILFFSILLMLVLAWWVGLANDVGHFWPEYLIALVLLFVSASFPSLDDRGSVRWHEIANKSSAAWKTELTHGYFREWPKTPSGLPQEILFLCVTAEISRLFIYCSMNQPILLHMMYQFYLADRNRKLNCNGIYT